MIPRILLALLLLQVGSSQKPPDNVGLIEGAAFRAGTREAIANVRVVLIRNAPGEVYDSDRVVPTFAVTTDELGRFSFKELAAGTYRLTFSANGFVRQEYGQRSFPGKGTAITIAAGGSIKGLAVEMTPTGSVSGLLLDENKRPATGVTVQLMRFFYDYRGDRSLKPYGSAKTDDRGEYRIFFVTPGRYYLNAGTPQGPAGYTLQVSANERLETYNYLYYPGTPDVKSASLIDVSPGADIKGMDMTLPLQEQYRVLGRVVDSGSGQPPGPLRVRLAYRDPATGSDYDIEYRGGEAPIYKDGTFEFRRVNPGTFNVVATFEVPPPPLPLDSLDVPITVPAPTRRVGFVPIQVVRSAVENVVITVSPGVSISGNVRVEGRESPAIAYIMLEPAEAGGRPTIPGIPRPTNGRIDANGLFVLDNVMPGEYRLTANLGPEYYVKQARLGTADLLAGPLRFTGNEQGTLDIVFSADVASLAGTVTDNRLSPAPGAQVVLVPDRVRHRPDLFKTAQTDMNGHFRISNIAPGDYKLYAWDAIEPYGWFDQDLNRKHERDAKSVRLDPSSQQTVDARLIVR